MMLRLWAGGVKKWCGDYPMARQKYFRTAVGRIFNAERLILQTLFSDTIKHQ